MCGLVCLYFVIDSCVPTPCMFSGFLSVIQPKSTPLGHSVGKKYLVW